jgi:7,8-dihydropterin-6-yl-methyl-4-(beta-D-ribofuranosyl)aminobenzene 5'-phosphate synthase
MTKSDRVKAWQKGAPRGRACPGSRGAGHCTGEPTFAALKQAFGNRYIYAGVGTSLPLGQSTGPGERRGEGPVLEDDDLTTYRKLARREDPFGVRARSLR